MWSSATWVSWMRWIDQLGTTKQWSQRSGSRPPSLPGEADGEQAELAGRLQRPDHVGRGARWWRCRAPCRRAGPAARAGATKTREKSGSLPIAVSSAVSVVPSAAAGQGAPLLDDRVHELDRDVLRVAGRAAVAHHVQSRPPACEALGHRPGAAPRARRRAPRRSALQLGALARLAEDGVLHATPRRSQAPAVLVVRRAGALGGDHRGAERRLRRAAPCRRPGSRAASSARGGPGR